MPPNPLMLGSGSGSRRLNLPNFMLKVKKQFMQLYKEAIKQKESKARINEDSVHNISPGVIAGTPYRNVCIRQ